MRTVASFRKRPIHPHRPFRAGNEVTGSLLLAPFRITAPIRSQIIASFGKTTLANRHIQVSRWPKPPENCTITCLRLPQAPRGRDKSTHNMHSQAHNHSVVAVSAGMRTNFT
jgi:hypothetical protein